MATKTSVKSTVFNVTGRITVDVGLEITAPTWEDVVAKSKELKVADFVEVLGDYQDDQGVNITSIWKNAL